MSSVKARALQIKAGSAFLLKQPRIRVAALKFLCEVYHTLYPFTNLAIHEKPNPSTLKKLFGILCFLLMSILKWRTYIKQLLKDPKELKSALTAFDTVFALIGMFGHLLVLYAQWIVCKQISKKDGKYIATDGPYQYIQCPHYLGKWMAETGPSFYTKSKIGIMISCLTFAFMVNNIKKEEQEYRDKHSREFKQYCAEVPSKLIPGIY